MGEQLNPCPFCGDKMVFSDDDGHHHPPSECVYAGERFIFPTLWNNSYWWKEIKNLTVERDAYREGLEKIINGWGTFPTAGADVHIELNKSALQDIANVVLSKYPKGGENV